MALTSSKQDEVTFKNIRKNKMKIYNVKREQGRRSNRYCGPAAISALTNLDTADTAKAIRDFTGKRMVTGVPEADLLNTMIYYYDLGYKEFNNFTRTKTNERPTLARWLKSTVKERTKGRVFLIVAGNHYQIVSGRRYVCGITEQIVSIRDKKVKRRARVKWVWEITKLNG